MYRFHSSMVERPHSIRGGPGSIPGRCARDNLRGQKSLGPLKMSLEMAHKVILPPQKNYIPQFLKQRDINSYKFHNTQECKKKWKTCWKIKSNEKRWLNLPTFTSTSSENPTLVSLSLFIPGAGRGHAGLSP
jgi:hypothetical protein